MGISALSGVIAAIIVFIPRVIEQNFRLLDWSSPSFILGIGAIVMILQRFLFEKKGNAPTYFGLSDLLIDIYPPFNKAVSVHWSARGVISFFLSLFGGTIGPEGASTELVHGFNLVLRPRSLKWFEQKRRSDASVSLASSISAAFGAPFAGILIPIELGIGGKVLNSIVGSISAFLAVQWLMEFNHLETMNIKGLFSNFKFSGWMESVNAAAIGVVGGLIASVVIFIIRYTQEGIAGLFQSKRWMRTVISALLLCILFLIYQPAHQPAWKLFEQVIWLKHSAGEVALLASVQILSIAFVLAGFGSIGVFWPLFLLGGFAGFLTDHWILGGFSHFSTTAGLVGAVSVIGGVLNIPLSSAMLAFELTQNSYVLYLSILGGLIARTVCRLIYPHSLLDQELNTRGLPVTDGKSAVVLSSLFVRDSMSTDFHPIYETQPFSELRTRIASARYPFFPVIDSKGGYSGLLTYDGIQEAWHSHLKKSQQVALADLVQAKDLLQTIKFESPIVRPGDRLLDAVEKFDEIPCLPVVAEDGRIVGLLFSYDVRLAYDRQVARSSFSSGDLLQSSL